MSNLMEYEYNIEAKLWGREIGSSTKNYRVNRVVITISYSIWIAKTAKFMQFGEQTDSVLRFFRKYLIGNIFRIRFD